MTRVIDPFGHRALSPSRAILVCFETKTKRARDPRAPILALTVVLWLIGGATARGAAQEPSTPQNAEQQSQVQNVDDVSGIDLQTPPFDRILLRGGTLYECEPLQPRPLGDLRATDRIEVRPIDGDAEPVKLFWLNVEKVAYFEDLLIKKADLFLQQQQFDNAFDYLVAVRRRASDWPGLEAAMQRLIFAEATSLLEGDSVLHAANLLAELRARNPGYPQLGPTYDRAAAQLLQSALRTQNYRHVRWLISQCDAQFPDRPLLQSWRQQMADLARSRMEQALAKEAEQDLQSAAHLIHEAARIWPDVPELQQHVARIYTKHSWLTVAVQEVPERFAAAQTTSTRRRVARLLYQGLIAPPTTPEPETYQPQLARQYELSNLGRRITFDLPSDLIWSDGETPITAMDVSYALNRQSDPGDPAYQPHWALLAPEVRVEGPFRLTVDFALPPLRAEALFQFPLLPQVAVEGRRRSIQQSSLPRQIRPPRGSGPFDLAAQTPTRVDYRANPHYRGRRSDALKQIVEEQFPDADSAVRALVRGRVALVEHVPPFELEMVRGTSHVEIGGYAVPRVHLIAFDFSNPALRVRSLRRAMVYAIDRETVLHNHLLAGAPAGAGAVLPGPLRRESAYAEPALVPRPYEPALAAALVANAKLQLSGAIPPLKLHHPPDDVARLASQHIQAYLHAAGVDVQLVERTEADIEQAIGQGQTLDLVYRITTTREPAVDVPDLLSLVPASRDAPAPLSSPWLRRLLVQLQLAPNLPVARDTLHEIDRVVHDEVAVLPLWQITDYFVFDRRLHGIGKAPLDLYQNVDQWQWEPTILKDSFANRP